MLFNAPIKRLLSASP